MAEQRLVRLFEDRPKELVARRDYPDAPPLSITLKG